MRQTILNRDFTHPQDGWYQIEAKGKHPNAAAGVVQVIDGEAVNSIVNRFNTDADGGKLSHGHEMLIDIEHFKDNPNKETRAYGWLQQLQNRDDGIYGKIRWTKTGKEAVDGGDYRFFSTEYNPDDLKVLNSGKKRREVRPLRLDGLTLTNMNNNKGQKPITNSNRVPHQSADALQQRTQMQSVAEKLGLSADASESSVLAEIVKLLNRVETLTPFEAENKTLKNRITALEAEQVDGLLDHHQVTEEKVRNRVKPMLAAMQNREERVAALLDLGFKTAEEKGGGSDKGRIINRSDTKPREQQRAEVDEQKLAQQAEAAVQDYKIRNRCSYADARNAVRISKPELFGLSK